MLRNQATPGRVIGGAGPRAPAGCSSASRWACTTRRPGEGRRHLVNDYGLTVLVPVVALVFASSTLGDLVDDRTLVYIWLRPGQPAHGGRRRGAARPMTICLPAVTVPLVISAGLTGGGLALIGGTAVAAGVGVIGYCGMFTALGLRFKRALVWGLAYIVLWEGTSPTRRGRRAGCRCGPTPARWCRSTRASASTRPTSVIVGRGPRARCSSAPSSSSSPAAASPSTDVD